MAVDPVWSLVGDNQAKGTSTVSVVTSHSTSGFATSRPDGPDSSLIDELLHAARPFLHGALVLDAQLQRWLYATPVESFPERTVAAEDGRIILAGDAFGGPEVEGAFLGNEGRRSARRGD